MEIGSKKVPAQRVLSGSSETRIASILKKQDQMERKH